MSFWDITLEPTGDTTIRYSVDKFLVTRDMHGGVCVENMDTSEYVVYPLHRVAKIRFVPEDD